MALSWPHISSFRMFYKVIFSLICTIIIWNGHVIASEFEEELVFPVFHSLVDGPEAQFTQRGVIVVHSLKNQDATYRNTTTLSTADILKLKKLTEEDRMYRIKVIPVHDESHSVASCMRACSLYESQLSDKLTLSLDQTGALLGVAIRTENPLCQGILEPNRFSFNTTVELMQTVTGPVPDTQTFVTRMEMEKAERARGEHPDNRSFLSKYWMYIVPLVIFLLISGSSQADAQGGRGAAH